MKVSTATLSALALGATLVNAYSPNDLRDFATGLGLSKTDINTLCDAYSSSPSSHPQDLSCKLLNFLFPSNTYLPNDVTTYESKVEINWSTRAWLNGTCVFSPSTTNATAIGVKIANFFNTQFAIRSGGHSPDPGLASTSEGILFSLENLNQIVVNTTTNIASIGPGNRWGHVYETLEVQNFVVVGGRVPPVGVGGLLTGGGLSYFTGTEGFAADNVQNYEVVLASGCIVNANAHENSDLWWALKGGGNNFGIVTRFDIKAIPKPGGLIWGGNLYYTPNQYPDIISAIAKFQSEGQITDPKAAIIVSFVNAPSANTTLGLVTVFHQDPTTTTPASLQPFFDIGPIRNNAGPKSLSNHTTDVYGLAADVPPMRQLFRDLTILHNPELYQFTLDLCNETFTPLTSIPGITVSFTYQPISVDMIDVSNSTGGHPLDPPRVPQVCKYPHYPTHVPADGLGLCLNVAWALPGNDEVIISAGKTFLAAVKAKAAEMGLDDDFLYLNDASADQPIMEGYGEANLGRLREVAGKYDPGQVFQRFVGGFKLY